jgi:hypothetical protein
MVLGLAAITRTGRDRRYGRGLAIAGIGLAWIAVGLAVTVRY